MNKIIVRNYNVWKELFKNLPSILSLRSRILESNPTTFNFNLKISCLKIREILINVPN